MNTHLYKNSAMAIFACSCLLSGSIATAQEKKEKKQKQEEIVIKKKGNREDKVTIVIDGDKVTINGEPVTDFKDDNFAIEKRNFDFHNEGDDWSSRDFPPIPPVPPVPPIPPLPPTPPNWNFNYDNDLQLNSEPKAMLGVYTEKDEKGARITDVMDKSPAKKAGLIKGDIITKVDGKDITDPSSLSAAVNEYKPDDEVRIQYLRDKKEKKITIKLGEHKSLNLRSFNYEAPEIDEDAIKEFRFKAPEMDIFSTNKPKLGMRIQDVEEGTGVKVIDIQEASAAEKAGIRKDDIITSIDGTEIKNADDAKQKIAEVRDKSSYPVNLLRNGSNITIEVKIPKKLKTTDL